MAEVMRQRARVVAIVRESAAAGMAKHVGVNAERQFGSAAGSLNHPQEPSWGYWRLGLGDEDIRPRSLEGPKGAQLGTA
jgi:hypothetical protein